MYLYHSFVRVVNRLRMNVRQLLRSIILAGFTGFFVKLHYTGEINQFVNPTYDVLSQIALGIFAFLFIIQLFRVWEVRHVHQHDCADDYHCHHHHESSSFFRRFIGYAIIIFPLLTGFMLSPVTLDASIAAKKGGILPQASQNENNNGENPLEEGGETPSPTTESESSTDNDDIQLEHSEPVENNNYFTENEFDQAKEDLFTLDTIHMNEQMYAAYYQEIDENLSSFIGKKIKVDGFVYREEGMEENQLVLSRFYMFHCVADASIIGFLSEFEEANTFKEDTWLELEGTIQATTYNGVEIPIIKAEKWTESEQPEDPYVYPALINLIED